MVLKAFSWKWWFSAVLTAAENADELTLAADHDDVLTLTAENDQSMRSHARTYW